MNTIPHLLVLLLAALLAQFWRFGHWTVEGSYLVPLLTGLLLAAVILPATGAFRRDLRTGFARRARRLLAGWLLVVTAMVALAAMFKVTAVYSRIWFGLWTLLGAAGLLATVLGEYLWQKRILRAGGPVKRLVLVGGGEPLERVRAQLAGPHGARFEVLEVFGDPRSGEPTQPLEGLGAYVDEHVVDDVWIALPLNEADVLERALAGLRHAVVDVHVIPDFEHYRLLNQDISEWAGLPFISLSSTPMTPAERWLKGGMDRVGSLLLIVALSPFMLGAALAVRASGPGPVLFRQPRHGIAGEVIDVLKFRTMRLHREPEGQVVQAREDDARVTAVGRFLRRTSLDELPQLFNVLLGQMSLVGPRPHALEHNELFQDRIPRYMLRHKVKPGITGWAQVNGLRGLTDTEEKMRARIEYDLWYIQNWSVWLYLTILLRTPFVMVHRNAF